MITELKILFKSFLGWLIVWIILSAGIFLLGIKEITVAGWPILVPTTSGNSLAVDFFNLLKNDLIPQGVKLMTLSPLDVFLSEIKIAFFSAFALTLPFLLGGIMKYLSPALRKHELRAFGQVLVPSALLFLAGCVFAYYFILPLTLTVLYNYAGHIDAVAFFDIKIFVSITFTLILVTGIMFLLPIFMWLSSYLGFMKYDFWKRYARHVLTAFVIFTAIITPDGSGITMILMTVPLCLLYGVGMIISSRYR